jgi:flagellar basal-body rod protein FlgF
MTESPANNFESGAMTPTGRQLDLAIQGDGFFTVLDTEGNEGYTRAGSMQMGPEGQIMDAKGNMVMGDFGPIFVPVPVSNINIAKDGTISVRPQGAPENALEAVGRLKLVNPNTADLQRGNDGLFRLKSGDVAEPDGLVRIESGMLEGSNVNAIDEMVKMMELQRHYELQVKFMKKAGELDRQGNRLLTIL